MFVSGRVLVPFGAGKRLKVDEKRVSFFICSWDAFLEGFWDAFRLVFGGKSDRKTMQNPMARFEGVFLVFFLRFPMNF